MKRSEPCNDLAAALAKAQAEMKNPGFDAQNPHFRNRFASLAAVRNAVVPVLSKHGISLCQELASTEKGVSCLTVLTHASGQWMEFGPLEMPLAKADPQTIGSATTYGKRYSLQAVAGVVGDEDDDAEAAQGRDNGHVKRDLSPHPDTSEVPAHVAEKYADAFRVHLRADNPAGIFHVHSDLRAEGELAYSAAWKLLQAPERSRIKAAIAAQQSAA